MAWSRNRTFLIGAGAVVVAVVALGVAVTARSAHHRRFVHFTERRFERNYAAPPFAGGPLQRRFAAGPGLSGPGGGVLHGEVTLPGSNGHFQTYDIQRGTVSSVSPHTLTVRSGDGFTKTYAAPSATVKGVSKGDEVQLRATVSGGKATVATLVDLSHMMPDRAPMGSGY